VAKKNLLPSEYESLGPRQRDLMDVITRSGGATLREVHSQIPDPPPSIYGIRTLLNRLVRKGLLRTRRSGRHSELLYVAVSERSDVKLQAFDRIAKEHFRGSKARAISALERLAAGRRTLPHAQPGLQAA